MASVRYTESFYEVIILFTYYGTNGFHYGDGVVFFSLRRKHQIRIKCVHWIKSIVCHNLPFPLKKKFLCIKIFKIFMRIRRFFCLKQFEMTLIDMLLLFCVGGGGGGGECGSWCCTTPVLLGLFIHITFFDCFPNSSLEIALFLS